MRNWLHVILGVLFLATLAFDFFAWGGLSRTPGLGKVATDAATHEPTLASVYLPTGRVLVDAIGIDAMAQRYAARTFAPVQARVMANPAAAMETLEHEMPTPIRIAYYAAPLLLVAFLLAFWRRPRVVRSLGRR